MEVIRWSILASLNDIGDLPTARLLLFRLSEVLCAAEVTSIREILPAQRATRIPGASSEVTGLINVRGELITLVDGHRLLGEEAAAAGPTLLLRVGEHSVGMAVDEVLDLISPADTEMVERAQLPGVDPRVVRAVGQQADRSFILLDLDALLGPILTS